MRSSRGSRPRKAPGQIRQSQIITTFGPGALVDLPAYSVIVGGLDHWRPPGAEEISEPRLVAKLRAVLNVPTLTLRTPPPHFDDPGAPTTGITAWQFPEWFITQDVIEDPLRPQVRSRYLLNRSAIVRGRFEDPDRKKHSAVPVRFVRACKRGHIGDVDWYWFVHRGKSECRRQLWIDERGTTGYLSEVIVRCECGANRPMSDAAVANARQLGKCDGRRPWLGSYSREKCEEFNRLLVRTASNAYFPEVMSAISLPEGDEELTKAVTELWESYLQYAESLDDLRNTRRMMPPVREKLGNWTDDAVFEEMQKRKGQGGPERQVSVKRAEFDVLAASKEEIGDDKPDGDFYARSLPPEEGDSDWPDCIERVVLVHRLREVVAQVGFTRFESITPDVEGELTLEVQPAQLSENVSWLPAIENRGEGIFVMFRDEAINRWLDREAVKARRKALNDGFLAWQGEHLGTKREFFGLPYIMLHSLSHLLITAVALECGYPASSIRERVYALEGGGYAILLHTGTSGAEGTLGGLVEVGRRLPQTLKAALDLGRLCSNDPVCAQHDPADANEGRYLHGAACHGCLLIAETSCEQHNDFLDRSLVVPTVAGLGCEFFPESEP